MQLPHQRAVRALHRRDVVRGHVQDREAPGAGGAEALPPERQDPRHLPCGLGLALGGVGAPGGALRLGPRWRRARRAVRATPAWHGRCLVARRAALRLVAALRRRGRGRLRRGGAAPRRLARGRSRRTGRRAAPRRWGRGRGRARALRAAAGRGRGRGGSSAWPTAAARRCSRAGRLGTALGGSTSRMLCAGRLLLRGPRRGRRQHRSRDQEAGARVLRRQPRAAGRRAARLQLLQRPAAEELQPIGHGLELRLLHAA
mmetsp:Transcript_15382/g.44053  ORF Transcript_15382/g.44053 Transcript_15382/m.44053 type:complete len:258 (+) Transcript_15382:495-1268(+)